MKIVSFFAALYIIVSLSHTFTPGGRPAAPHQAASLQLLRVTQTPSHFTLTLFQEAVGAGDLGLATMEGRSLLYDLGSPSTVDGSVHWNRDDRRFRELSYLCESPENLTAYRG